MKTNIAELYAFIVRAEKLKVELRHSWNSDPNRQESVAEHSWMMALLAMAIFDEIDIEVDQLKVMKMVAIHDLAEAITGDIPSFATEARVGKYKREQEAMRTILTDLPKHTAASRDQSSASCHSAR